MNDISVGHFIGGSLFAGAARGALNLHVALRNLGMNSTVYTNSADKFDASTHNVARSPVSIAKRKLWATRNRRILNSYKCDTRVRFDLSLKGYDLAGSRILKNLDILHFHWVNSLVNFSEHVNIDKPIVWTLRDQWATTGGCHYILDCNDHAFGCRQCPCSDSVDFKDIVSRTAIKKREFILTNKVKFVALSKWMRDETIKVNWAQDLDITVIGNAINTKTFKMTDRKIARNQLELEENAKYVLFGALDLNSYYKNPTLSRAICKQLLNETDYHILTFGRPLSGLPQTNRIKNFGIIRNDDFLVKLYNAANIYVSTSKYEAFGKTVAEALSCGTPAVALDNTGPSDIIVPEVNGRLVKTETSDDFMRQIIDLMQTKNSESYEGRRLCRQKVVAEFEASVIAKKYQKVYSEVM